MKIQKTFMTIVKHLLEYLSAWNYSSLLNKKKEWKSKRTTSMIIIHLSDHLSFLQHLLCKRYNKFSKFLTYEKYWKKYLNIDSKTCLQDNCQISNCLLEYLSLWNTYHVKDTILHHWINEDLKKTYLHYNSVKSILLLLFFIYRRNHFLLFIDIARHNQKDLFKILSSPQ